MSELSFKLPGQTYTAKMESFVFFVFYFLITWLWIDPKLFYHAYGVYMLFTIHVPAMGTYAHTPPYPGQPIELLSGILSHYFYFSWAGALIITAVAWLLTASTDKFMTAVGSAGLRVLRFVPALIMLMITARYYHYLPQGLSVSAALLLLYIYINFPLRKLRFFVLLIFSAIMYTTAIKGYLLFAVLCGIVELTDRRILRNFSWLLAAVWFAVIPYLANISIYNLVPVEAYNRVLPFPQISNRIIVILRYSFYLFIPAVSLLGIFWRSSGRVKEAIDSYRQKWFISIIQTVLIAAIMVGCVWIGGNTIIRKQLRVNYFADQKMWAELLDEAETLVGKYFDMIICHDVDRALFSLWASA